ncbi:MAG: deoxyhypusine synthase family protein, partial [Promethearchaeota archaeon]
MKHYNQNDYLLEKIIPFDLKRVRSIEDLLENLKYCGFQGRNLGKAFEILEKMVKDEECLTVLALSGAMVPAGMGNLICSLIEYHIIDVLITTGANIAHDLVDAIVNIGHYIGSPNVDDNELYKLKINRIYDIFLPEDNYIKTEKKLLEIINEIFEDKKIEIAPSEFLKHIGKKIKKRSILSVAAKHDIPIFIPAFSDSELSLDLIRFTINEGYEFNFNI